MKKIVKKMTLVGVAAVSALALTACSSNSNSESSNLDKTKIDKNAVLHIAVEENLETLNPIRTTNTSDADYITNVALPLTEITPEGKLVGAGAESWEKSSDAKTWTFKIRDGLKYASGESITAEDYAFTMKAAKADPKLEASNFTELVDKMEVVDGNKLSITFTQPQPAGDSIAGYTLFTPLEESFYNKVGAEKYGSSIETSLFSGPYTVTKWEKDQVFELSRNESYFAKDQVSLKGIERRFVADGNAREQLFQNKETDMLKLTAEYVDKYANDANKKEELQGSTFYLMIGNKSETMRNKHFRRALNLVIDKETLAQQVIKGANPTESVVGKEVVKTSDGKDFRDFSEAADLNKKINDATEAKKELKEAKSELGKENLEIDYLAFESGNNKKIAEYFKQEVESSFSGVKVNIRFLPQQAFVAARKAGDFDLCFGGWSPDYSDPMNILELLRSTSGHNYGKLGTPETDKLIADADAINASDKVNERYAAFAKAEKQAIQEDTLLIPLFQNKSLYVTNGKIGGVYTPKIGGTTLYKYAFITE